MERDRPDLLTRYALIVAHGFPPAGGPGVQRVLKFVKYLPEFGWQPVVLTVKPEAYEVRDETFLRDIPPDTPIFRVWDPNVNRLRPYFSRLRLGKLLSAFNVALMLPDAHLFWAQAARSAARQIIARYQPRAMLSSSPPASTHLLASWIRQRFAVPWIADFRDPWSQNPQTPYYPGYRAFNRRLEKRVLSRCDHVTTVSPPWAESFQRLSDRPPGRVTVIENGYDDSDVSRLPPPRTERFTITYAGTFSPIVRPDAFVDAVRLLLKSGQIPSDELRVLLAGKNVADFVAVAPPFENLGYLNHSALEELRLESDLLLLIIDDSPACRGVYSGKVFEHLGCNRPTLCITHPENVAAQLIVRARAGAVAPPHPEAIAAAVMRYYRTWKAGEFAYDPDWELIRRFTRRRLTRRLAQTLERVADES